MTEREAHQELEAIFRSVNDQNYRWQIVSTSSGAINRGETELRETCWEIWFRYDYCQGHYAACAYGNTLSGAVDQVREKLSAKEAA